MVQFGAIAQSDGAMNGEFSLVGVCVRNNERKREIKYPARAMEKNANTNNIIVFLFFPLIKREGM